MEQIMLIGGFVPLPFVLYAILQTLRKHPHANLFGVLLAYLAVLIPVGVFAWGTARQTLPPLLTLIVAASAAITFLFGFVLFIAELRRSQRKVARSYGLLSIGVSAFIVLGVVVTPTILALIPNAAVSAATSTGNEFAFAAGQAPVAPVGAVASESDTTVSSAPVQATPNGFPAPPAGSVVVGDSVAVSTATPMPTVISTHSSARQAVLPTITPSQGVSATPVVRTTRAAPTASAAPVTSCQLQVLYNLNLRAEPRAEGELLLTIPYGTIISANEVSDAGWWQVSFSGQTGWVNGDYVSPMLTCYALTGD